MPQEFLQNGGTGHRVRRRGGKEADQLQHPLGLQIVGVLGPNLGQGPFGQGPQHGQLIDEHGIDEEVRVLVVGVDVDVLAPAHLVPQGQGVGGAEVAELHIPDHAADEAVVRGGQGVVVVQIELGQGGDEDAALLLLGDGIGQPRVQGVDALHDEDLVVGQPEAAVILDGAAGLEVVAGKAGLLALQQLPHVLLEQLHVQGLHTFVVRLAVGAQRRLFPVHVIVVHGDLHRMHAQSAELDAQPTAGRGLARAGGAGQQHQPHFREIGVDGVGDVVQIALLQGLGDEDQVGEIVPGPFHDLVQLIHGADAHQGGPVVEFGHGGLELHGQVIQLFLPAQILAGGQVEHEAVVKGLQLEFLQAGQVGGHDAEIIVPVALGLIHGDGLLRPAQHQGGLAGLADACEIGGGVLPADSGLFQPQVGLHVFLHVLFDGGDSRRVVDAALGPDEPAEHALGQGVADHELQVGEALADHHAHKEDEGAGVGAPAQVAVVIHPFHFAVDIQRIIQLLDVAVDDGGHRLTFKAEAAGHLFQGGAFFHGDGLAAHDVEFYHHAFSSRGADPLPFIYSA